jgi:hypothetical protein
MIPKPRANPGPAPQLGDTPLTGGVLVQKFNVAPPMTVMKSPRKMKEIPTPRRLDCATGRPHPIGGNLSHNQIGLRVGSQVPRRPPRAD